MASPAAPVVMGGMAVKMTSEDAPKFYAKGIEIKKLVYGAEKPSDLELAANKFADLAATGKVMLGNAALGAATKGVVSGASNLAKINFPDTTPSGLAVVTVGRVPISWRMLPEGLPSPKTPWGDLIGDIGQEAGQGSLEGFGVTPNRDFNNFGGPASTPEALEMAKKGNPGKSVAPATLPPAPVSTKPYHPLVKLKHETILI